MSFVVVGSLAYDTIQTPAGRVERTLGGSANYFCLAMSFYGTAQVVGVVGEDYRTEDFNLLKSKGMDLEGLQKSPGKTFHWEGRYKDDLNEAETLLTELNVFSDFSPKLPVTYQNADMVFLANIDPHLQMEVLNQTPSARCIGCDTMNLWIENEKSALLRVLNRVDVLMINEGEARLLTGSRNAIAAAMELRYLGPKAVVIKRGEYGFIALDESGFFMLPAFPIANVVDPTGAGDSFAGAFWGHLNKQSKINSDSLRRSCIHGSVMASFTVEDFGTQGLQKLTPKAFEERFSAYRSMTTL